MDIATMEAREDLDEVLRKTLQQEWTNRLGHSVSVDSSKHQDGQVWYRNRILGGYFIQSPDREVRRYLRDSLRYTPRRRRLLAQWALVSGMSSGFLLTKTSRPAFSIHPAIVDAESMLIVPGNQRLRIFDFKKGTVRSILKEGFSSDSIEREIAFRTSHGSHDFILGLESSADDHSWFEERIVDGYPLPRCPPWYPQESYRANILGSLESWAETFVREVTLDSHLETLRQRLNSSLVSLSNRFDGLEVDTTEKLGAELVSRVMFTNARIQLTTSHGDLQGGNILIPKRHRTPLLIDWEHTRERWKLYDRFVLGLGTRSPANLHKRWRDFVHGGHASSLLESLPSGETWRRSACALVALEDLIWYANESTSGPFRSPSMGLGLLIAELKLGLAGIL